MKFGSRISNPLLRIAPPALFTLLCGGEALAQAPAPILEVPCTAGTHNHTYRIDLGTGVTATTNPFIKTSGPATVSWSGASPAGACSGSGTNFTCAGMAVTLPSGSVASSQMVTISGTSATTATTGTLQITSTSTTATMPGACVGNFTFETVASGGGWGDPHLTTVDGVHYDFQSAGEFTALREEGLVIQTRQSPVPTATVPITNAYTGITHCVSIYTAVAAKLGKSRVTVQPSAGAEPDPNNMVLRVDGKPITLGDAPFVLRSDAGKGPIDGTLTKHADGVVEITDARGTQLVVTPRYWDSQKVWYLNVNVYGTSANQGTMGVIAPRSWLPALPDGSSVGPRPEGETERYQALYEKFADAWRVTDATSLFDYAPGTNTATFTRDEWPRNHPQSCAIEGQTSVQGVTAEVAQQACANVVNATQKADCVFDVMITGHAGFAKSYEVMQRFAPRPPGWYSPVPEDTTPRPCPPTTPCPPPPPAQPWWCCWFVVVFGIVQLVLLVYLVLRARKKP